MDTLADPWPTTEAEARAVQERLRGQVVTHDAFGPLFVSTGHRVSLATAVELVLRVTRKWRLPEPIRLADALSRMHG